MENRGELFFFGFFLVGVISFFSRFGPRPTFIDLARMDLKGFIAAARRGGVAVHTLVLCPTWAVKTPRLQCSGERGGPRMCG